MEKTEKPSWLINRFARMQLFMPILAFQWDLGGREERKQERKKRRGGWERREGAGPEFQQNNIPGG